MGNDQRKLNPELAAWLEVRQARLNIVKTTTTPSGKTLDWVPIESQTANGKIATPPPGAQLPERKLDAQRPVNATKFELDDANAEHGPPGTVPLLRPDITRLTRNIALRDFHTKKGGSRVNRQRHNLQSTDPNPAGYFHDTDSQSVKSYGWDGFLSVWAPSINNPNGNGEDHSILQVWLQNYSKPQLQSLEGGWTVDNGLNGNTQPHLFTYYTTNGYNQDGDNEGGYNTQYKGFVQYSSQGTTGTVIYPGIQFGPVSVLGGAQYDISMKFQLYREPNNGDVNWWLNVQGIWVGYYPASLYKGGLGNNVDWVGSGGEIYSGLGNPENTKDQMGSGKQASAGWAQAAFLRNLRIQSDMNGNMVANNGSPTEDAAVSGGANPYTIDMHMNSGSSWGSYFYVGGPTAVKAPAKGRKVKEDADVS